DPDGSCYDRTALVSRLLLPFRVLGSDRGHRLREREVQGHRGSQIYFAGFKTDSYKGRLSFLPVSEYIPKSSNNNTTKSLHIPTKNRRVSMDDFENGDNDAYDRLRTKSVPWKLYNKKSFSESEEVEEKIDEELADVQESMASGDALPENTGSDEKSPANGEIKFALETENNLDNMVSGNGKPGDTSSVNCVQEVIRLPKSVDGKIPSILPPLDKPLPSDWVTLDEEFVSVAACYQTHLGSDSIMAPDARFNDGIIHLSFIKSGIQKGELLQLMSLLEKGTHIDFPSQYIEMVKCLAFRLEPEGKEGIIMVDGERVDYGPLQGQVLPGASNLMAIHCLL
ncbi:SPHK2-like protein, partial [Mya arenaria]